MPAKEERVKFCGFNKSVKIPEAIYPIDHYEHGGSKRHNGLDIYKVPKGMRIHFRKYIINVPEHNITYWVGEPTEQ